MSVGPFEHAGIASFPTKESWDAISLELFGDMLARWRLTDPEVLAGGVAAVVARVRQRNGERAVLKIGFPHIEGVWEAVVLDALPRDLAPAVLRQDPWTWSMLVGECRPGTALHHSGLRPETAIDIAVAIHRRIVASPAPVTDLPRLSEQYGGFVRAMDERLDSLDLGILPVDRGRLAAVLDDARLLLASGASTALLHGDLNPSNILQHGTGWRVIDPKPLIGDPAFDLFPLIRDLAAGGEPDAQRTAALVARATQRARVDMLRTLRWCRVRCALSLYWYLKDALVAPARVEARWLDVWDELIEGSSPATD